MFAISNFLRIFHFPRSRWLGIPEVKTVLSGFNIFRYFSLETFIAKIIGLYFSMVGGEKYQIKSEKVHLVEKWDHSCIYLAYCATDY